MEKIRKFAVALLVALTLLAATPVAQGLVQSALGGGFPGEDGD